MPLNPSQIRVLEVLAALNGGFMVGGTRGLCDEQCYSELREAGYLEEHWTWASTTRPDCGISQAGLRALENARASRALTQRTDLTQNWHNGVSETPKSAVKSKG